MDIIRNNKGGQKLCYGGYMYTRKTITKNRIRWECTRRNFLSCHGAISTDRCITVSMNAKEHSHESNEAEVAMAKLKHQRLIKNVYGKKKISKTLSIRKEAMLDATGSEECVSSGGGQPGAIGGHTWREPDQNTPSFLEEKLVPEMTMISDSDQLPGQMVKSQHFTSEMTMISDSDQLPGQMVKSQRFTPEMTVISDSDQLPGQMVKSQCYTPDMTVISDSDQLPGQMVKTQCFSPEMAMISDSDQLPEQMVKTQHFTPELPVKCEPDQLEIQIVKTQHFTASSTSTSASPPPGSSPTANPLLAGTNIPLPAAGVVNEDVPILVMPPPPKEPHQYDSKKTKEATKYSAKIFRDFCHSRGISTAIEDMVKNELDELLTDFYINVRTQSGQYYSFSSLVALRHGLNRYLKNVNIVNDPAFRKSNLSFKVALKRLKEAGKGSIEHKEPISQADMATLYSHSQVFNPNTPEGLLNKVWFEVTFYFFRRGQENQRYLTPNHFGFATDEYGRKYVYKRKSLSIYTNGCNMDPTSSSGEGRGVRMYATGNAVCPVATFERYLRKRNPHESALFQHPRTTSFQDSIWYNASPLGKEALSTMMRRISLTAKLSRVYTNHCIRATAKFVLFQVFDAFQQFDPQQGSASGSIGAQSLPMAGINSIPGLSTLTSHDLTGTHDAAAVAGALNFAGHPAGLRVAMVQADAENSFISAAHLPNLSEIALNRQEAMEVQSAVAAATANIIPQSPIESYDPGPEQSLQNSKMRGCTDKDMALSFSASSRSVVVFKKTYVDPEHTDGMMKSLASLWRKRRLCDAKICSGDKNVTLHRLVLFAASPHLMEKNITDGADLEVNLPAGISEDGLKIFVSFLYDGVLNLNEHLYKDVERISNLLKVDKVQKHCREFSASLNEHRQMTSSPLMSIPRRRDNLPKSQKSSNRQTVVLTLSDDSNPAESSLGHSSAHQQPQEHTLTLSQSQYEDLQNNIDERIQALNEHHAFMTSHHDRYPPVTQNSGISLQTATNPTMASESGIKTEPIEILDDDITDYTPTTTPTQDNIKHNKRILNSSKSFASESPGSETMRRSSQNLPSSTVTRTYLPTSKCESGLDMNEMDGIATSGASSTTSPYPVSLVASSGETFPLYTLSSNQS